MTLYTIYCQLCNTTESYLSGEFILCQYPPSYSVVQACNATQRYCKACSQDPFDVGDGVEEPGGPAEPRMGPLHDPPARYIAGKPGIMHSRNDIKMLYQLFCCWDY